jgi:DNA polymerase-3 subunit alpha
MIETIDILIEQQKKINFVKFNESIDSKTLLNQMVMDGLKKRKIKNDEIYLTRANTELDVINKMNLNDYFLVVQDYVNYAKKNNIYVGPGRGSAAGSLVSFLLNITGIDPIANDLIFERFLNEERETMPDIDVDFEDDQRYKVIEYIFDKYTNARTSYIITFQRMKAKMALTDVGRILEIDLKIIKMITGLFGVQYETDIMGAVKKNLKIKEYYDKYPQLFNIASKIINFPRSIGIHPAGIILCGEEITNILPTIMIDEKIITQFEAEHMEPLGLIKMDILGLSNLTIIKEIINLIKENKSYELKLEDIEIDNENVLKQMSNGDTVGIFQLESNGMTNLIRKLKPKNVEEISQVLALFRPGPMENIKVFLENKNAPNNIQYINQQFEKVLKKTYNIVVYQEQMMELIKIICNYSYAKADIFRRIISKKKIDQLALLKKDFINDAIKNNYSEEQSNKIFSYIESFADYGFNHSHSLSYAYISYWMAYLKYYYPLEFITVLLTNNNSNVDKVNQYIEEAKSLSLKVLPPSIKLSKEEFIIKNDAIIFGLNAIKGFGISKTQQILELRKKYDFKNYNQTISVFAKNNIGISTIQLLIKSGTFDELLENKSRFFLLNNLENIYNASKLLTEDGNFIINPQLDNSEPTKEILEELKIEQFNLLGFDFSINQKQVVLDEYRGNNNLVNLAFASMNEGKHKVLAKIVSIKHINTKYGAEMAFINASDESKTIRITI